MTRATNNTNKASESFQNTSRVGRWNHSNFEDNALLSLLIRGQALSDQRNSGTTVHSNTCVPRPAGLVGAMEEAVHLTSRYPSGTSATTIPQRTRLPRSLGPPSDETMRRNLSALLSEAFQLVESCNLLDNDDESDDL
jgi:hypothetical protein